MMRVFHWRGVRAKPRSRPAEPTAQQAPGEAGLLAAEQIPALTLARTITVVAVICYSMVSLLNVYATKPDRVTFLAGCGCLILIFVLQMKHSALRARLASRRSRALSLTAQALLTYLPLTVFGWEWGGMAGFLAASVLLLLPGRTGRLLYVAITLSMIVYPVLRRMAVADTAYFAIATALTGLVIYGLSTLSQLVFALHAMRGELARTAVSQERLRFAQDLHDLLGYSLSAVILKAELIGRLISVHPERAREEIAGVLDISRQALADVRTVANAYRDMSLMEEAASAKSILAAADIRADIDVQCGTLDPDVDTVLATVVREGVTNALRHSQMRYCSLRATVDDNFITISLVNDGVSGERPTTEPGAGNGLGNLALRVAAIGGRLTSGFEEGGRFRLTAKAQLIPDTTHGVNALSSAAPAAGLSRRRGAAA